MKVINKLPSLLLESTLRLKRKILGENRIVIVATPHKVGSTWLFNLIKDSARLENGINHLPPDKIETGTLLLDTDSIPIVENLHGSMIFKSHSCPPQKKLKENIRLVTMYRDPRDVIVSSSFFLANIDEDVGGLGRKIQ